jgi:hypothetical protein
MELENGFSPRWGPVRRIVVFLLGITVVIDAVLGTGNHIGELVIGAVLLGIIPVDELLDSLSRKFRRD